MEGFLYTVEALSIASIMHILQSSLKMLSINLYP